MRSYLYIVVLQHVEFLTVMHPKFLGFIVHGWRRIYVHTVLLDVQRMQVVVCTVFCRSGCSIMRFFRISVSVNPSRIIFHRFHLSSSQNASRMTLFGDCKCRPNLAVIVDK
jgi:hypothetical protein